MTLLIDNYDSFSYNLYQMCGSISPDIQVIRNDALTTDQILSLHPDRIILSPGPGHPKDAGVCEEAVGRLGSHIPILGVCLGHQGICEAFGAKIAHAGKLMHGKQDTIRIYRESPIFLGLPDKIKAARYHSLIARRETLPECLSIIGEDSAGEVMAVGHKEFPIYGLQFHPESILTPYGSAILKNFFQIT